MPLIEVVGKPILTGNCQDQSQKRKFVSLLWHRIAVSLFLPCLRALADAPDAFGVVVSEAEAQPMSYWEELTRSVTEPGQHVMFLACKEDTVPRSAYGLLDRAQQEAGRVGGMWVAPAARRRGIGRALLHAVIAWARGRQLMHLELWAPAHSPAAVALYRRAGFRETGRRRPLPNHPALEIIEMACEL
jgi:GNAT superfamily N-acetyltransferase